MNKDVSTDFVLHVLKYMPKYQYTKL